MKFRVQTGQFNVIVEAETPDEAAIVAFTKHNFPECLGEVMAVKSIPLTARGTTWYKLTAEVLTELGISTVHGPHKHLLKVVPNENVELVKQDMRQPK